MLHPVSFLVGVGVAFLPLAIRVVVDGTLKYVCHPPRLLRSSGACLLVSFLGALMLGGAVTVVSGLPRWFVNLGR